MTIIDIIKRLIDRILHKYSFGLSGYEQESLEEYIGYEAFCVQAFPVKYPAENLFL